MRLALKIPGIFLPAVILFSACEKSMFIDVSEDESKLVLNGIISPGSGIWLNVSESIGVSSALIKSYIPVENATIRIYNDDLLVTSITENDAGNYFSTGFSPHIGASYRILVDAAGYPTASSMVKIPDRVEIIDFDTSSFIRNQYIHDQRISREIEFYLKYTILDPAEIPNYYMLGAYYLENGTYESVQLETEDLGMNIYIKDGVDILAWNDCNFNGTPREFDIRFRLYNDEGFETEIVVTLYSIEKVYFDYLKTYSQNFTVLNDDMLLFEPVLVATNIEGGHGIIAAVSSSSIRFNYTF